MAPLNTCPQCGTRVADTTLEGLCPACTAMAILGLPQDPLTKHPDCAENPDLVSRPERPASDVPLRPIDFGGFELIEEIARGGMGVVYKARQKQLKRLVALKMILAGRFAGEEEVKRFRTEAEAGGSLRHPNIVAIHDVGELGGQHYFCMDLIDGPNLGDYVRRQPLSPTRAARLVTDVARAVQFAHEQGVIHRDLKPSNIIVDARGQPHITDFGLAKRLNEDSDLTRTGQGMGSPNFTAPEQAAGRGHETGPSLDVYSLGAILYYLLVGRPPFSAGTLEQTLAMVLANDPIAPRHLDPAVPADLETSCLKCLEKEPGKRYATAGEVADELERWLRGEPIRARAVGPLGRAVRWCRRNPTIAALIGAVAAAVILGFAGVLSQWRRAESLAHSESTERARAEGAVSRLESQRIEDLLRDNQAAEALAQLAHAHRRAPTNEETVTRMLSVLNQRGFPLPSTPPMQHNSPVHALEFSPDGTRLISASGDHTAVVWDTRRGRPAFAPLRHARPVEAACFSPDGRKVATASADRSARVWSADTGEPLTPHLLHGGGVLSVNFSPDGLYLVTSAADDAVRVLSATNGRPRFDPIRHDRQIVEARFSPDGRTVVSASGPDSMVLISDARTGTLRRRYSPGVAISSAKFSADGKRLAVATQRGLVMVLDPRTGQIILRVQHPGVVHDAVFSPEGDRLVTVSSDRRALVWDAVTGALLAKLEGHQTWVEAAEFSKDGLRLLTQETGHRAFVWDLLTGRPAGQPIQAASLLYAARFSPDGQRVAAAGIDGRINIWTVTPGAAQPLALLHSNQLTCLHLSSDNRRAAGGHSDGRVVVWDITTGRIENTYLAIGTAAGVADVQFGPDNTCLLAVTRDTATVWRLHDHQSITVREPGIREARFSADGKIFLTIAPGMVRTWATDTGQPFSANPIRQGASTLWHAQFSPDGRSIATAAGDYTCRLWDIRTGSERMPPMKHGRGVRHVSFSPDGTRLLTASRDHTAAVWSVSTGERLFEMTHRAQLHHAQFSPDGHRIVTASFDNTARVWDAATGLPLTGSLEHEAEVQYAEFSPDGRWVATASLDGVARVWNVATGLPVTEPLEHSEGVFIARFTPDGRRLLTGATCARVWEMPALHLPAPGWLSQLADGVAGQSVDHSDRREPIPLTEFVALRQRLEQDPSPGPWASWARWFLSDRMTRSLALGHPRTVPEAARLRSGHDSLEGCQEAVRLAPLDGQAWMRLASKTAGASGPEDSVSAARAIHHARRAVALIPKEPESWLTFSRILTQFKHPVEALAQLERGAIIHTNHAGLGQARAELLAQQGRLEEAYAAFSRLLELVRDVQPSPAGELRLRRRKIGIQFNGPQEAQRDWLQAAGIPTRPTNCPSRCLDLSTHYTAALHEPWHNRQQIGHDLTHLASPFVARDIPFDLRGIIQLAGVHLDRSEPGFPAAANGIAVGRPCAKLHFLYAGASGRTVPDDTRIGEFVIHYEKGPDYRISLKTSVHVHGWYHGQPPLASLPEAHIVDAGRNAAGSRVRLFLLTWINPRPDALITTLDFVSDRTAVAPFLVGVTTEP